MVPFTLKQLDIYLVYCLNIPEVMLPVTFLYYLPELFLCIRLNYDGSRNRSHLLGDCFYSITGQTLYFSAPDTFYVRKEYTLRLRGCGMKDHVSCNHVSCSRFRE